MKRRGWQPTKAATRRAGGETCPLCFLRGDLRVVMRLPYPPPAGQTARLPKEAVKGGIYMTPAPIPGQVFIKGLHLRLPIGITPEERSTPTDVRVHITLWTDFSAALVTDNIAHTVDYTQIYQQVLQLSERNEFQLVESLAGQIAELCLAHPRVTKVKVSVEKPAILKFVQSVGVELVREA